MASKGLGPLPRRRGSALALGCGRGGRVVLPLPRAAAVSTGLRVLELAWRATRCAPHGARLHHARATQRQLGSRQARRGRGRPRGAAVAVSG